MTTTRSVQTLCPRIIRRVIGLMLVPSRSGRNRQTTCSQRSNAQSERNCDSSGSGSKATRPSAFEFGGPIRPTDCGSMGSGRGLNSARGSGERS